MKRIVASEEETADLGTRLARAMTPGTVITLSGPLGAGKTLLARAIVQALGHPGSVKSPTYTLVETYRLPSITLHHFDLYRLADPEELEYIGLRDFLETGAVCLFEWPERAPGLLPPADLQITIRPVDNHREISLIAATGAGKSMIAQFHADKRQ